MTTLFAPLVIPWIAATFLMVLDGRRSVVAWTATAVLAVSTAAAALLAIDVFTNGPLQVVMGRWGAGIGISMRADGLAVAFLVPTMIVLTLTSAHAALTGVLRRGLPAGILFVAVGLTGLFFARDLFNFYVFFEVTMSAAFVLAVQGDQDKEQRAGLIFVFANLIGSFLFLVATAAMYRLTGTLDMDAIAQWARGEPPDVQLMTATLFFVAFAIKLGLFPFHFWVPAVYRDSSAEVAAVLSGAVANIGSYGLIRFGGELFGQQVAMAQDLLITIGVAGVVIGALQAAGDRSIREVLAYSSISQAGYILVAVALGTVSGLAAAVFFAIANSVQKAGLFLANDGRGFAGLVAFAVCACSVAGIPPTLGFFGKTYVFYAAIAAELPITVVGLFVGSALGFVYMFRAYQRLERHERDAPITRAGYIPLVIAAIVFVAALWPEPLLWATAEISTVLGARVIP